jgi:hypothetical protein
MCLPNRLKEENNNLYKNLIDLENIREEVVREVINAPNRRINNEISNLNNSVALLLMHCNVLSNIIKSYKSLKYKYYSLSFSVLSLSFGIPISLFYFDFANNIIIFSSSFGFFSSVATVLLTNKILNNYSNDLIREDNLNNIFKSIYAREIANNDEEIYSLWKRIKLHLLISINSSDIKNFKNLNKSDLLLLNNIIENEIPKLRRSVAPALYNNNISNKEQ